MLYLEPLADYKHESAPCNMEQARKPHLKTIFEWYWFIVREKISLLFRESIIGHNLEMTLTFAVVD